MEVHGTMQKMVLYEDINIIFIPITAVDSVCSYHMDETAFIYL